MCKDYDVVRALTNSFTPPGRILVEVQAQFWMGELIEFVNTYEIADTKEHLDAEGVKELATTLLTLDQSEPYHVVSVRFSRQGDEFSGRSVVRTFYYDESGEDVKLDTMVTTNG